MGMALLDQIQQDMVAAMKAKEQVRLDAIRMIKTALTKARADANKPFDEKAELQVLSSLLKQRHEAAEMFRQGGREDSARQEEQEALIIESYMPSAPTDAEMSAAIEAAVSETGASSVKDLGAMMKAVQARLVGKRVDGKVLSERVRARLGG
ncbi:MAG: GatB/YqeY domain-containing protein [Bryobacterales bacterium]|nr:GatB/YqeY domain-containing protein [Bryobacterales bacterium]